MNAFFGHIHKIQQMIKLKIGWRTCSRIETNAVVSILNVIQIVMVPATRLLIFCAFFARLSLMCRPFQCS